MRTSETLLLDFIRQSPQLRIPVNQRRFGWTQRECRQLWEDYSATIWMGSAELTGAGESVQVRREGKANHYFHRKPCGRIREGAVEASVAARVAGMIEHRKRYDPERRGFLIDRRQHLQSRHGEGLPGSALSEESRDARTPLYRDSGGLQFASAVVPGPRKKGDNPNR